MSLVKMNLATLGGGGNITAYSGDTVKVNGTEVDTIPANTEFTIETGLSEINYIYFIIPNMFSDICSGVINYQKPVNSNQFIHWLLNSGMTYGGYQTGTIGTEIGSGYLTIKSISNFTNRKFQIVSHLSKNIHT